MTQPDRRGFLAALATSLGGLTMNLHASHLRAAEPSEKTLKVLIFGGPLPDFRKDLEKEFRLQVLSGGQSARTADVTGLEQLADADVFVGSAHKRTKPSDEQLAHFKKFHESGKPFVGYRAVTHVFENWLAADKEVFGARYGGHHLLGKEKSLKIELAKGAAEHPILKGLTPPPPLSGSYHYTDLADDVRVLLTCGLPGDRMPHTWIRENARTKGRVFYTRYDAKDIASNPVCREIFLRGFQWALNRDLTAYRKTS